MGRGGGGREDALLWRSNGFFYFVSRTHVSRTKLSSQYNQWIDRSKHHALEDGP